MKPGKAYYVGGARIVVGGIPIRLARQPSVHNLAYLRDWERHRVQEWFESPQARAEYRANAARQLIERYADRLGISVRAAKNKIERQRLHMLANPVRDLSLEYDL